MQDLFTTLLRSFVRLYMPLAPGLRAEGRLRARRRATNGCGAEGPLNP